MPKISHEAVQTAYALGKRVYKSTISRSAAIKKLQQQFSINPNSAADMINNVSHMLNGERYVRTNNNFATNYFLEKIRDDFGLEKLANAVAALTKHLDYYEALPRGSKQPAARAIAEKFQNILQADSEGKDLTPEQQGLFERQRSRLDKAGEFHPSDQMDARERTVGAIVRRQGQPAFRSRLLSLYDGRCAISGCDVGAVLEAAHILPYKGPHTNHPANGLLLRGDLHTLFDLGLITVVGSTMTVMVSERLSGTCYEQYAGVALRLPHDKKGRPSSEALDKHRKMSQHSKWIGCDQ